MDCEFETACQVLEAKRKEPWKQGLGKKEHAAEPISHKEEDLLWESKQLGEHSPYTLLQCGISTRCTLVGGDVMSIDVFV